VARFLETVPCLSRVVFPGLASHPCHTRAVKYFGEKNSGAVLRFHMCLYGPTVDQMLTDPHPFMHAVSLGESHTLLYPVPGESRLFPEDAGTICNPAPQTVMFLLRTCRVVSCVSCVAQSVRCRTTLGIGSEWPSGWRPQRTSFPVSSVRRHSILARL
jgi:hypothetical protein